eukprot:CAMPEP_0170738532 /NCGR_PEP_ID=MMETSP0437-20130122/4694_1 /TAXON_ID=0 /ORGANISM="Sexangularia sp." /LENGTH=550 /DNA_ID=CAMNT_0011076959 /DNA_START=48 /DNA_END=1700 /DNA_ORIENTATION=-
MLKQTIFLMLITLGACSSSSSLYKLHADDTTELRYKLEEAFIAGRGHRDNAVQAGKTALPSESSEETDDDDSSETSVGRKLVKAQHLIDAAYHRGRIAGGFEEAPEPEGVNAGTGVFGGEFVAADGVSDGRNNYHHLIEDGTSGRRSTSRTLREDYSGEFASKLRRAYFHGRDAHTNDVAFYSGNRNIHKQDHVLAGTWTTTSGSGASSHSSDNSKSDQTSKYSSSASSSSFKGPEYSETARELRRDQRRLQHAYEAGVIDGVCDNVAIPSFCGKGAGASCMDVSECTCSNPNMCPHVVSGVTVTSQAELDALRDTIEGHLQSSENCVIIENVQATLEDDRTPVSLNGAGGDDCLYVKASNLEAIDISLGQGDDCAIVEQSTLRTIELSRNSQNALDRLFLNEVEFESIQANSGGDNAAVCINMRDSTDIDASTRSIDIDNGEVCVVASRSNINRIDTGSSRDFVCYTRSTTDPSNDIIINVGGSGEDLVIAPSQKVRAANQGTTEIRRADALVVDDTEVILPNVNTLNCCEGDGCPTGSFDTSGCAKYF